jgi:hypothetical protein
VRTGLDKWRVYTNRPQTMFWCDNKQGSNPATHLYRLRQHVHSIEQSYLAVCRAHERFSHGVPQLTWPLLGVACEPQP